MRDPVNVVSAALARDLSGLLPKGTELFPVLI
jgi:hypothetical protein